MKSGAITPKVIVTDRSKALQNAISLAFNTCSFGDFNEYCLKLLNNSGFMNKNIKCWLRVDIAHLIHSVARWKCFSKTTQGNKAKYFFCLCIGLLTTIEDFLKFKKITTLILTTSSSILDDKETQDARKILVRCLETFDAKSIIEKSINESMNADVSVNENFEKEEDDKEIDENMDINLFIKSLQPVSLKYYKDKDLESNFEFSKNDFYVPKFKESFNLLLLEFPCWTNLMNKFFQSNLDVASSARSEAMFAQVKSYLRDISQQTVRMDKFLVHHCRMINADLKLAFACVQDLMIQQPKKRLKANHMESIEHLYQIENWRNKAFTAPVDEIQMDSTLEFNHPSILSTSNDHNYSKIEILPGSDGSICFEDSTSKLEIFSSTPSDNNILQKGLDILEENLKIENLQLQQFKSENSKVNIIEKKSNLMDKNCEIEKSRGKFVKKDPELKIKMSKPSNIKINNKSYLKNANLLQFKLVDGSPLFLSNTCAFDSISELMVNGFNQMRHFQNIITENRNIDLISYLDFIYTYAEQGPSPTVYKKRAYILKSLYNCKDSHLDCYTNINNLFDKLFENELFSIKKLECECKYVNQEKVMSMQCPAKNVQEEGFKNLEEAINYEINVKGLLCRICNQKAKNSVIKLGPYLWLDVEYYFIQGLGYDYYCSLNDIPKLLLINNRKFYLSGAVQYVPGHYISFCRSINDKWDKRDDMSRKAQNIAVSGGECKKPMKFSSFLYIESTD